MAQFVQAVFLRLRKIAIIVERVVLEKKAYLVARFLEVFVTKLCLLHRRKHVFYIRWVERVDQIECMLPQFSASLGRYKPFDDQYARITKIGHHFGCQFAVGRRRVFRYFAHFLTL